MPSGPPRTASSSGSNPSQETASPRSTPTRKCCARARCWLERPSRITILSPLRQDPACGCLHPWSWAHSWCSPPLLRSSAQGGRRRRRGLFPNKHARSRGALACVFTGVLGKEAMVGCRRCLKDGPPQSIPGVSSAHTFQTPNTDPGVGGAFLPLSFSPQPHLGAWGDSGTPSRHLPTKPGLCLVLCDTDVALGQTGLLRVLTPQHRCLLLSARSLSFLTNCQQELSPSTHPEDTANSTPWGRHWRRNPQRSDGRQGFNAETPTGRRQGLSLRGGCVCPFS